MNGNSVSFANHFRCIDVDRSTHALHIVVNTPLQAEVKTELDALLPSILDRAFKGEL